MNQDVLEKCELLIRNHDAIRSAYRWSDDLLVVAGSSFFVGRSEEISPERLKSCEAILKEKTGRFSEYRGNVKLSVLCKMAVSEDPERYIDEIRTIMDLMMNGLAWSGPEYKVLAAMTIHDHAEPEGYAAAVEKTVALYQNMKENHRWLTSGEDVPFAAMLASSGLDTAELVEEMENCYQVLKESFGDRNAIQSLSHVLAVDKAETAEKCSRVKKIFDLLKENGHKYAGGYELIVLGALCRLDLPCETIAEEIGEADDYLKTTRCFKYAGKIRVMYAALMVLDAHMPDSSLVHDGLLDGTLAAIIAAEICMMVIICCTCVTVSSAT